MILKLGSFCLLFGLQGNAIQTDLIVVLPLNADISTSLAFEIFTYQKHWELRMLGLISFLPKSYPSPATHHLILNQLGHKRQ